jgi:sigma-B regulation protein RsbU (phosphoserine phosphatase)
LAPHPGVNWRVVTVLPEQAFMATVSATQRNSVALAVVCGVGALLLAMRFGERLTRPLVELANHVVKVGKGDFDSKLELEGAKELREVSRQVNRMAAGLRERMELEHSISLAKHVQQSLLPAGPPEVPGLEVFGQSQYCDATGGDYYDFIDVSALPSGGGVMVAVGDVTGHGIGSALVMATARAALRSTLIGWAGKSLGEVLCKVNRVLAEDARHGLFMTMVLMEIDVARRRLRWASAGHEPAILYNPVEDTFEELDGGDIPLGIEAETEYMEYTRGIGANDRLMVIGTDGIWEARNRADEMFGRERLR